ncbi:DUF2169 domain-containing protein [Ensifer sp. BR816]|uniref:DUF2169 family type VI secretion system accessory protein n=1 Tax=Rhizobium sp. (strain BR816) TaxID=1057002 RepID=UPI0003717403|nr:DUF2169 domain-containing protein [Ensifer sp. BR816]
MSVDNRTPFPAIAFRQFNLAGDLLGVVAARGTFLLASGGPLVPAKAQHPLILSDVYDGNPHEGPLTAQSDLVPFKPATDVTFNGASFSPEQAPRTDWTCRLRVGPVEKRLRVTGPRSWRARTRKTLRGIFDRNAEDVLDGWELTEATPVAYVPIDWRLAYGGLLPGKIGPSPDGRYRFNSIGRGIVDSERYRDSAEYPAPQIEDPAMPVGSNNFDGRPEGFGAIAPWWEQRYQYAGTYGDEWLAKRHPLLPGDFDFRYWQCAHPDLIAEPWLNGDEEYELENLVFGYPLVRGTLPKVKLQVTIDQGRGPEIAPMVLDGVHFDFRPGIGRVYLTWRTGFPWPQRIGQPRLDCLSELQEAV